MAQQVYDVIVIGTGAGGGMAIKTLCEADLKVCALNAGRRLDPEKDFRFHRMPWEMKFRGLDDPKKARRFRAIVGACDLVVAGNEFLAAEAARHTSADRIVVIPTCVEPASFP